MWKRIEKAGEMRLEDKPLSEPSESWLRRMRSALVDYDCSERSFRAMDDALVDYYETLEVAERNELRRRLDEFFWLRNRMPLWAT